MKKILPLVLLFLAILSACTGKEAEVPAPPTPSAPIAEPTPEPENAFTPTPSPTAGLAELLAAAEGQDFDVWAHDVVVEDLAQSADFAEHTGLSALSAQPKNITQYVRRYGGGYCYESFHRERDWEAGTEPFDVVLITDAGAGDGFRQELSIRGNEGAAGSGGIAVCDIDLDGHDDAELFFHGGSHGVREYTAILWDAATESYRAELSYQRISKPVIDQEHKIYWGGYSGAVYESRSAFEYIDGEFVETHRLYIQMMPADGKKFSITESGANEEELNSVLYTAEEGELLPDLLERYAENDAVWPGWQWNDFFAHYQYG